MNKIIFGVSSTESANKKLTNGYTVYDWVVRQNCFPSFWGRKILGDNVVTKKEIEFLKERICKLKLIVGDLTEKSVSSSNGYEDASRSIAAADGLASVYLFEAQKFANNGIPTIGINEKNITIISPNKEKLLTNWESDGIITNNVSVLDGENLSYYSYQAMSTKPSDSFSNTYFSQNPLIV